MFLLIVIEYLPCDALGSSHAPPASSSIGVGSDVFNMDAAAPGGSATAESNIISDKFLVTPLKNGSGSLGGESCDNCYTWFGGFCTGIILISLNVSTVTDRNESKYPSEIRTGTPSQYIYTPNN